MGIKGHRERALIRRGLYVQEALQRRNTLNENALIRRNLVETEEDEFDSIDSIKVDILCNKSREMGKDSFWCELKNYIENSQLSKKRIKELYNYITLINASLRPTIDNKRVMVRIGSIILKHSDPLSVFKMLAEWLKNPIEIDKDGNERLLTRKEFVDKLSVFNDENIELNVNKIKDFLRAVRNVKYTQYEKSFVGNNFSRNSGYIQLPHGHDKQKISDVFDEVVNNIKSYTIKNNSLDKIKYINEKGPTIDTVFNGIKEAISKADPKTFKNKADLIAKNPLVYKGKTVIPEGGLVEVKMLNYSKDSYFSEFFAIYKNEKNLNDLKFNVYREVIMRLYRDLNGTDLGNKILKDIQDGVSAMIFDDEIIVEKEYIELYWSTTGARDCTKEPRLTIRYRIKSKDVVFYKYDRKTDSNQLTIVDKPPFNLPEKKQLCN